VELGVQDAENPYAVKMPPLEAEASIPPEKRQKTKN